MTDDQQEKSLSRRSFLDYLLGGSLLAWLSSVLYPVISYLNPPKQSEAIVSMIKVGKLNEIPDNSGRILKFGNKPAIIVRSPKGELTAFIAICSHLDCTVQYRKDEELIWCACHNGKYDLNGINISGPPPRPLERLKVSVKNQEVFISRET